MKWWDKDLDPYLREERKRDAIEAAFNILVVLGLLLLALLVL